MQRFERYKTWISGSHPAELESWVRGLLIHYFFHVSDRSCVEIDMSASPQAPRVLNLLTPTVFKGLGRFRLAPGVVFGVPRSPGSYACSYVEARTPQSLISIDEGTVINNRATIMSEGAQILIGKRCLIGSEFQIVDSNFHQMPVGERHRPDQQPQAVVVEDDVFIGSRVTLLKGCRIGHGSVIAAGSVVPPEFVAPPLSIVAGNPARRVGQVPAAQPSLAQPA
jgi:acetyltransferase-like isoleucine patch superfamily enzyme